MNRNVIIVLAGGFLIALLVAMMMQAALGGKKKEGEPVPKVQILVASKDLSVGHELGEGDLKWQDWPEETMFMGAIIRDGEQQPSDAISGKLLRSLSAGQPMHMSLVVADNQGEFLSANLQKGMRAVGVEVRKDVVADRLIKPGDFVDVLVTYRVRINTRNNPEAQAIVNRYATETVIENIRVMAVDSNDTKAVDESEKGKAKKQKGGRKAIVTLEVHPKDAEKLLLAKKMGDIGFALRPIGNTDPIANNKGTTDIGISQVMTNLSSMSTTSSAVRIYSGNQMQEVRGRSMVEEREMVDFSVEESLDPEGFLPQSIILDGTILGIEE